MEPEPGKTAPPSQLQFVFFNDRGLRAGWRLLIFLGMILAGLIFVGVIVVFVLLLTGEASLLHGSQNRPPQPMVLSPWQQLAGNAVQFLIVLLATWVMSRIERRKMAVYGLPLGKSICARFLVGYVLWGFLPLTLLLLVMRALGVFYFGNVALHGVAILRFALLWGLVFLFVGLLEEYLTRGYMLYTLADGIGFWPAAIVMAALFGIAHMPNPGETRVGIMDVCLFAIFAAVTLRRTGSLWLAVGAHAGWDWGQTFFYGVNDSGLKMPGHLLSPHIQGPEWLSGGSVGPEGSLLSSLLLVLMTVAFLAIYRPRHQPALIVTTAENQPAPPTS